MEKPTNAIMNFRLLSRFLNLDLGQIRHTKLFIVIFNTVYPKDGRRRRPKHAGVVSKQP